MSQATILAAAPPPNRVVYQDQPVTILLDRDLRLACEDQATAAGERFDVWLSQFVNDCLRANLGL